MIAQIKTAAESVGITAVLTNSREHLDTQINKMTRSEDLPLMLISWDLDFSMSFDQNGFLNNPNVKMVVLLMDKASDEGNQSKEDTAILMGEKFQEFTKALYTTLVPLSKTGENPISEVGYKLAPLYGKGMHSGVIGRLTTIAPIKNC